MSTPSLARGALALCLLLVATHASATPIAVWNPGFETAEGTAGPSPNGLPNAFGDWAGDASAIGTADNGITPFEGSHMLHFISSANTTSNWGLSSDIWQLVDMTPFGADIATGTAVLSLSAVFNRIAGDAQTEPQFAISIRAYSGLASAFPGVAELPLADATAYLMSDGDPLTWEILRATLPLPSSTTYVGVRVAARETINDSPIASEFAGHYADQTTLDLQAVPEPASLGLLGSGIAALLIRRSRTRRRLN